MEAEKERAWINWDDLDRGCRFRARTSLSPSTENEGQSCAIETQFSYGESAKCDKSSEALIGDLLVQFRLETFEGTTEWSPMEIVGWLDDKSWIGVQGQFTVPAKLKRIHFKIRLQAAKKTFTLKEMVFNYFCWKWGGWKEWKIGGA